MKSKLQNEEYLDSTRCFSVYRGQNMAKAYLAEYPADGYCVALGAKSARHTHYTAAVTLQTTIH